MLGPDEELFSAITKLFMEEWQIEFGQAEYFLVDSFNELQLPETVKAFFSRVPNKEVVILDYAKQIISTWRPPVNDYACWVWSGLICDFYTGRMGKVLEVAKQER